MTSFWKHLALAAVVVGVLAAPAWASREDVLEGQPSIHNKRLILDGRHMVAPTFSFSMGDEYETSLIGGVSWRYFLAGWIGLGLDISGGTSVSTDMADKIRTELTYAGQPFELSTSQLRMLANVSAEIVPLSGKLMLFGAAQVRADVHLDLGFGVALVSGSGRIKDSTSIMPIVGAGVRLFPTDWIAIGLDFRDHLVNRVLASRRDGSLPGKTFGSNWITTLSVGFFFPTVPEVRP